MIKFGQYNETAGCFIKRTKSKKSKLNIFCWNVRIISHSPNNTSPDRRTAFVARELSHHAVDNAAVFETRLSDVGQIEEHGEAVKPSFYEALHLLQTFPRTDKIILLVDLNDSVGSYS